jgi:hypothetical protein
VVLVRRVVDYKRLAALETGGLIGEICPALLLYSYAQAFGYTKFCSNRRTSL